MFEQAIGWLIDIGMAIGPILGYVSQYRLIKLSKSVGSFSIDICGILLFANILRLNFYMFKQYQTALFFQSILMVSMQILLLYECVKYPNKEEEEPKPEEIEPALSENEGGCAERVEHFWRWATFQKYGVTILFFIFCSFTLSLILKATPISLIYGQLVGLIALTSQSILILPQIIRNLQKQSTKGLSHMLVTLNLSGDILKLIYFLANNQPFQFILCGIVQVVLDSFVVGQIFYYNNKAIKRRKSRNKEPESPMVNQKIQQDKDALDSQSNLNNYGIASMASDREVEGKKLDGIGEERKEGQIGKLVGKLQKELSKEIDKVNKEKQEEENYQELKEQIDSDDDKQKQQQKQKQKQKQQEVVNKDRNQGEIQLKQIKNNTQPIQNQKSEKQQQQTEQTEKHSDE